MKHLALIAMMLVFLLLPSLCEAQRREERRDYHRWSLRFRIGLHYYDVPYYPYPYPAEVQPPYVPNPCPAGYNFYWNGRYYQCPPTVVVPIPVPIPPPRLVPPSPSFGDRE